MSFRTVTIVIISCLLAGGFCRCGRNTDMRLASAEQLILERPDSVLEILSGLENRYPAMDDSEKALYGLLLTRASVSTMTPVPSREFIDYSVDYYTKTNDQDKLAYSYVFRARLHKNRREYEAALRDMMKATQYAPKDDYPLLGLINFEIGHLAAYQSEHEKALEHLELAAGYFGKAGSRNNLSKIYRMQGMVHLHLGNGEMVIESYRKAIDTTTDPVVVGDALNDIGEQYFLSGQLDSALYYTRVSLGYPHIGTNKSMRYYNMANIFYSMELYDSSFIYAHEALEFPTDIYYQSDIYRLLTNLAFRADDTDAIAGYLAEYHTTLDSIKTIEKQTNINVIEEIHQGHLDRLRITKGRNMLYLVIAAAVAVGVVVSLLLYRRNMRNRAKAGIYRTELERRHEMLLLELADDLERTKVKYAPARKKAPFDQRQQIDKSIYNEVLHVDDEREFTAKMNKVLNRLPEKLKAAHPDINYKELVWCCLFVLRVPTNDISTILDYTQSSQYKFKQCIAKKFGLAGTKQLEQMLLEKVEV